MIKLRELVLKNGQLERVSSLPPVDRVASLAVGDCKLTLLTTSFLDMDPPTGVFTRAYEELHYLNMILCKAASAHMAKEFMERPQLEDLTKGFSVLDEAERQQQQHDGMMRGILGNVGFEEYQKQHFMLYNGVGLCSGHTVLDEIERQNEEFKKQYGWGASNSVQDEMERLRTVAENSLGLGAVGSAFEEMERQREEIVKSTRARDAVLGHGVYDSLETHPKPISDATPTTILPPPIDSHPFKYLQEENKRLQEEREKQRLRDERQERQARNSDALLRAQAENDQKAEVDRRFSKQAQVLGLIIAAIGAIGSFISAI